MDDKWIGSHLKRNNPATRSGINRQYVRRDLLRPDSVAWRRHGRLHFSTTLLGVNEYLSLRDIGKLVEQHRITIRASLLLQPLHLEFERSPGSNKTDCFSERHNKHQCPLNGRARYNASSGGTNYGTKWYTNCSTKVGSLCPIGSGDTGEFQPTIRPEQCPRIGILQHYKYT